MPAIAELFVEQVQKVIEFDLLNPQGIIQLFDEDFTFKEFFAGVKGKLVTNKDQEASILGDLSLYIFALLGLVLFLVVSALLSLFKKHRDKIFKLLFSFKRKFCCNGMIRSLNVMYI
jgi:hypothetical protein